MNVLNLKKADIKKISASELKQVNGGNSFLAALAVMDVCIQ